MKNPAQTISTTNQLNGITHQHYRNTYTTTIPYTHRATSVDSDKCTAHRQLTRAR